MALINFSDIPRSVLAHLLDVAGKAECISPRLLMGNSGELDPHQLTELYAGGFIELPKDSAITLSPAFVEVAQVLLHPHTNVTFRIWGRDNICGETNIQFPRDIAQGDGVIVNQIGGYYRISAFIEASDVTELLGKALPSGREENIAFEFDGHFDAPVAAILFGTLDLTRNHARSGLRPGETVADLIFSTQQIYDYMSERWGLTSFKDMITYIMPAGMMAEQPSLSQTVDGVRSLVKAGVLKETKVDSYQLSLAFEPLVNLTIGLEAGMQWQRVSLMDSRELILSNRIYLFGDKSFILSLVPTLQGKVFISRVRRKEIIDFILDEITASLEFSPEEAPAPGMENGHHVPDARYSQTPPLSSHIQQSPGISEALACNNCGFIFGKDAVFCGMCGTPVEKLIASQPPSPPLSPQSKVCSNCNKTMGLNAKFCAGCGTLVEKAVAPLPHLPIPPMAKVCLNCKIALGPNAKFCTGCGKVV
jgi:hypothetical protein